MPQNPDPRRLDKVTTLVTGILAKYPSSGRVDPDGDLARVGMSSIDMVELMLAVEAEFDLTIPPGDITLANFSSIRSVEALVGRLRPRAEDAAAA